MKTQHKSLLIRRAKNAVKALYHNATPEWFEVEDSEDYWGWFQQAAEDEIDFLNSGGAHSNDQKMAEWVASKYTSGLAKNKARRFYLNKTQLEIGKYAPYENITRLYGQLYQHGRGGRTVAPDGLMGKGFYWGPRSNGMENAHYWGAKTDFMQFSYEDLTQLIITVEAFNAYVKSWNSKENLYWMYTEFLDNREAEKENEHYLLAQTLGVKVI